MLDHFNFWMVFKKHFELYFLSQKECMSLDSQEPLGLFSPLERKDEVTNSFFLLAWLGLLFYFAFALPANNYNFI